MKHQSELPRESKAIDLQQALYNYFRNKARSPEDAKDLTQEVWWKLLKGSTGRVKIKNHNAWVFSIAKNTLIDYYRVRDRHSTCNNEMAQAETPGEDNDLQNTLECCLSKYIDELDDETRVLLTTAYLNGNKQIVLAEKLNIPYATVRSKIRRGRKQIRKMFERDCDLVLSKTGKITDCSHKALKNCAC